MPAYTFHSLSDVDFEDLACDLLGASLGTVFQPFTKGRDSGIDLLHGARINGSTIVQCKHYCRSTFAHFKAKLTAELPKLSRFMPARLIIATSIGLTPGNKEVLRALLTPYCISDEDIYGLDDLNRLLRAHPAVEATHYKLWLTSVPVLQRVLRHGSIVWQAMSKADIERKMSLYVQTGAYGIACRLLGDFNYCILCGIPGVGKTTLAQVLVTRLMDDGYELIAVRSDVDEAFESLDVSKKQVVYYDDFLGQSSLSERLGKNEDRALARLLVEARRGAHLKVILTTREYILEDAKRVYEPLSRADLDIAKCTVKVEDYTRLHRARILYNHVYFSSLPLQYAVALLKDRAYFRIIDHKGYSPRIVEWMTLGKGVSAVTPDHYVSTFLEVLDNPGHVWQHAFDNQINDDARAILFTLGSFDGWVDLEDLRKAWAQLRGYHTADGMSIATKRTFQAAMKQLDGSFIRSTRAIAETAVEFHNPSIKDYVRRRIVGDLDVHRALLMTAQFFEQLSCLLFLSSEGRVEPEPGGLFAERVMLHEAVRRTIVARAATYSTTSYHHDGRPFLLRHHRDIGARLARVALWSQRAQSEDLVVVCCELAAGMIEAGEISQVADVASCDFLDAVLRVTAARAYVTQVVQPFVAHIGLELSDNPSVEDWEAWTVFVRRNSKWFGEDETAVWASRADAFCANEVDVILDNARSKAEAEQSLDALSQVADAWGVHIDLDDSRVKARLEQLRLYEGRSYVAEDHWEGSFGGGRKAGGDLDIERMFESLGERPES